MKLGFVSLGCPKNLVDGEVMLGLAREAGHEITTDVASAEVLVVNTCAFIDIAREESVNTILEMAQRKRDGACRRLVVTGCLAERYRDELKREIPEIDVVLGTGEVPAIVEAIRGAVDRRKIIPLTAVGDKSRALPTYLYDAGTPRTRTTPAHYAYLKVAEGCDYKCAFCIIPTLRGSYRSRTSSSILAEARALAGRGVREIILISQDTTFYGIDRHERGALGRLLRDLNRVDGIEWIRLLYLYPTTITDETLAAMAECEKVCKYIDLPLQHASDEVLRRMKRPGARRTYEKLLAHIRARIPGVTLRSTFIVGFPGERGSDFDELCAFVRDTALEHLGVFTYSHEEGTSAHALRDDVPDTLKNKRQRRLMRIQRDIVARAQKQRIGQRVRLLIDGSAPEHPLVLKARTEGQAPDIDSLVYLTEADPTQHRPGTLVDAMIVAARQYDLIARPSST